MRNVFYNFPKWHCTIDQKSLIYALIKEFIRRQRELKDLSKWLTQKRESSIVIKEKHDMSGLEKLWENVFFSQSGAATFIQMTLNSCSYKRVNQKSEL